MGGKPAINWGKFIVLNCKHYYWKGWRNLTGSDQAANWSEYEGLLVRISIYSILVIGLFQKLNLSIWFSDERVLNESLFFNESSRKSNSLVQSIRSLIVVQNEDPWYFSINDQIVNTEGSIKQNRKKITVRPITN